MFAFKSKKSKKEKQEELKKKKGYNPFLVARVQPQGGISFKESYLRIAGKIKILGTISY